MQRRDARFYESRNLRCKSCRFAITKELPQSLDESMNGEFFASFFVHRDMYGTHVSKVLPDSIHIMAHIFELLYLEHS